MRSLERNFNDNHTIVVPQQKHSIHGDNQQVTSLFQTSDGLEVGKQDVAFASGEVPEWNEALADGFGLSWEIRQVGHRVQEQANIHAPA